MVMKVLINKSKSLTPNGLLIEDVRLYDSFFIQLCYSHVKRECNKVVHSLTRYTTFCDLD